MGWDDLVTAESYAEHVDRWGVYRDLNRALARFAVAARDVDAEDRILDLACGSGATVEALLAWLPFEAEVLAVDGAEAMVEQARLRVADPRVRFAHCRAEDVADLGCFDIILCGAAFWHFDAASQGAVLERIRRGGVFAFNLPKAQCRDERVEGHPIQAALADVVSSDAGVLPAVHPSFDRAEFALRCAELGIAVVWRPYRWSGPQEALIDLLRIPAMAELVAPGLPRQQLDELVERAADRVDPDQPVSVDWWLGRATLN